MDGRGLLCFQCAPGFLRSEEELVAKSLATIAARRNLEIVSKHRPPNTSTGWRI